MEEFLAALDALIASAPDTATREELSALRTKHCGCATVVATGGVVVNDPATWPDPAVTAAAVSERLGIRAGEVGELRALIGTATAVLERSRLQSGVVVVPVEPSAEVAPVDIAAPPDDWFENPKLTEPTPFTVWASGRAFGHVASWELPDGSPNCHIGYPDGPGVCVTPPRSKSGYQFFRTGEIVTASGRTVPIGTVTMGIGHAGIDVSAAQAVAHYDNTAAQAAFVAAGEDDIGIWVAGSTRPSVLADDDKRLSLRAAALSGDWRPIGRSLEMVAALAVNTPGFPTPRPTSLMASGTLTALVAANIVRHPEPWEADIRDLRQQIAALQSLAAAAYGRTLPSGI